MTNTKQLGLEAETIFENIQRGIVTLQQVIAERDTLNFLKEVNPTKKEFKALSAKEKALFFDWCELNRVICSFEETTASSELDTDDNGNQIALEW